MQREGCTNQTRERDEESALGMAQRSNHATGKDARTEKKAWGKSNTTRRSLQEAWSISQSSHDESTAFGLSCRSAYDEMTATATLPNQRLHQSIPTNKIKVDILLNLFGKKSLLGKELGHNLSPQMKEDVTLAGITAKWLKTRLIK
ncbi:hypothetical protein QTG54_016631 [Skeletonema marinoi]|uniref:Uncharacterized protein n=1 Tax=Skeletonema marinoi TaxID=267567 RepID=A0AAD8XRT3_9STRA|nr:hypothetical protein QTG54_016631 [Skeletonema marinoi]